MNKNVLVLVPGKDARGGVTTYYLALRKHLPKNVIYLERGARKFPYNKSIVAELFRLVKDYINFLIVLIFKKISLVHTNTTFGSKAIYRDSIYLWLAKLSGKKTIVFYRGWDNEYADRLLKSNGFVARQIKSADTSIVLSKAFAQQLKYSGYTGQVFVETTTVDVKLLELIADGSGKEPSSFSILYLARLQKEKGIYIVLEAFKKLKEKYENLNLQIGGDGQEFDLLIQQIKSENIQDITLHGFVSGQQKADLLNNSDLYIFPTDYIEGMPNSVLEAFAFGLPVITRPVAGLVDIFKHDVHGSLLVSLDPNDYANEIERYINDSAFYNQIVITNRVYAQRFYSSNVASRLLDIYNNTLSQ